MISDNPDVVLRFLRATLKGHQYALDFPDEALEICLRYADNPDPEVQRAMLDASIPLIYTGYDDIGWMQQDVWQGMHRILADQNLLEGPVNIEEVFTLQFLKEIYGEIQ